MKLWHLAVVLLLLGAGGYLVASELRYNRLLDEADAAADTVELYRARVDSLTEVAVKRAGEVAALEAKVTADSIRFARERRELALEVRDLREDQDRLEITLRASLNAEQAELLDSLTSAWSDERRALHEDRAILEERVAGLEVLRQGQAEASAATELALDSCRCALDAAEEAIEKYQRAASSSSILGRAWDAISSRTGLSIIAAGVVAWGVYELVSGDDVTTVIVSEPRYTAVPAAK